MTRPAPLAPCFVVVHVSLHIALCACAPAPGEDAGSLDAGILDAGSLDGGASDDAGASVDGGLAADGGASDAGSCAPGDRASGSLGPAGGSFEHCGARIEAPEGALVEEVVVSLEVVAAPLPLPFQLESAGPAFRFEAEGEANGLTLILPALREGRIVRMFVHDGEGWNEIEPCVVEDSAIGQESAPGFVYAALREVQVFPDGPTGLGDGSIERTFQDATTLFDVDGSLSYAIYDEGADGSRAVTVRATLPLADDHLDLFHLVLTLTPEGLPDVLEVTAGSTGSVDGFWTWVGPVHQTGATLTLDETADGRLVGTLVAEMHLGDQTAPLSASLDVAAEAFRYPPEGYCAFPEG